MLGYKSLRQFLITYAAMFGFAIFAFFVRLAKFDEFTLDLHIKLFATSVVLIIAFWEALRVINFCLDKVYPFETNIPGRISVQVVLGGVVGLIIRGIIYHYGEPQIPFKLDSLFIAATWALYLIIPTGVNLGF